MTFVFVCAEHEEYGVNGWRLKSQPGFDPLSGMAVAHDCLEHFTDSDQPHDEFMALGACIWVRGADYYGSKGWHTTSPGQNVAGDLPDIMNHITGEGMGLRHAPVTHGSGSDIEEEIEEMFAAYRKEKQYLSNNQRMTAEMRRDIWSWMRIGYRKAQRRYHGKQSAALDMFMQIERDADKYLKHAEQGMELHVQVNFARYEVKITLKEDEYYDGL